MLLFMAPTCGLHSNPSQIDFEYAHKIDLELMRIHAIYKCISIADTEYYYITLQTTVTLYWFEITCAFHRRSSDLITNNWAVLAFGE